ncbi:hypothetical protein RF11_08081 [Thelohanellus kitauei]|uniref:Uncharacterized protein n=1 Tax=Thelohanellus kitauei TaxID=669202 RepID=A0A0C2N0A1_THEKT|nr:hypothetical protein RF11_08081 [Thelohanellus kitauei]
MDISTYQKRFEHKPFVLPSKTVTQTTNDKTINTNFISIKMDINGNTSSISKYHIYSDNLKNEMPSYDQTKEFLLQSIERNTKMKDLCKSALKSLKNEKEQWTLFLSAKTNLFNEINQNNLGFMHLNSQIQLLKSQIPFSQ